MKYLIRILIIVCLLCLASYMLFVVFWGYPVIINISSKVHQKTSAFVKDQNINPLNGFDFNSDDWTAYLLVNNDDYKLLKNKLIGNKLVTKDIGILKYLKKECEFTYTEGDLCTVTSSFKLYKNGVKVFETGIVLEGSVQGFQSQDYGWITTKHNLISVFNKFDKIKAPLIFLK